VFLREGRHCHTEKSGEGRRCKSQLFGHHVEI